MLFMLKAFSYLCTQHFQLTKIMNSLSLQTKLETLPPELKMEVNKFVDFLIEKSAKNKQKAIPVFGSARGKIRMATDFNDPLDDFQEYM